MTDIAVSSKAREQVINITDDVAALATSMDDGVCTLSVNHSTCALTIPTNEAGIAEDFLTVLRGLAPPATTYVHDSADHVRAHVLSALVGPFVSLPVRGGPPRARAIPADRPGRVRRPTRADGHLHVRSRNLNENTIV